MKKRKTLTANDIHKLLRKHSEVLKKYRVRRIGLYGSYARGAQRKLSDIDFIVDFIKPSFDDFMELSFSLESILGRKIDLITHGSLSPRILPYVSKEIRWYEI